MMQVILKQDWLMGLGGKQDGGRIGANRGMDF